LFQLANIGKNKKQDPASFPVSTRITRSVTHSRNIAKFDNCSNDNNDELHCYEQSQMVPEEVNNLVNPQDLICHVEVSPPCAIIPIHGQLHHYSKIAQSPPTIKSPCCNHLKLAEWLPSLEEKIRVLRSPSQFWLCPMTTVLAEVEALQPSERPPRKRMRGQQLDLNLIGYLMGQAER
jgi:hypothetical protein